MRNQGIVMFTAVLAVAMPVFVVHNWLERVVDRTGHEMEDLATRVFTVDLAVGIEEAPHHAAQRARAALAAGE